MWCCLALASDCSYRGQNRVACGANISSILQASSWLKYRKHWSNGSVKVKQHRLPQHLVVLVVALVPRLAHEVSGIAMPNVLADHIGVPTHRLATIIMPEPKESLKHKKQHRRQNQDHELR